MFAIGVLLPSVDWPALALPLTLNRMPPLCLQTKQISKMADYVDNVPAAFSTQVFASKEALRKAALEVYMMRTQVNASEAQRAHAAIEASQRQAAVEALEAQYQELQAAVSKANQKVVGLVRDVHSAKNNLALAGAALSLQSSATFALQGQLNNSMAAEAVATAAENAARANVTAAADALADALALELDKKSIMYQIIDLGEQTRQKGDPNKQLGLIQVAIEEATADAQKASAKVANATAIKAEADAALSKLVIAQDLIAAKVDGIETIMKMAQNETTALQVSLGFVGVAICCARCAPSVSNPKPQPQPQTLPQPPTPTQNTPQPIRPSTSSKRRQPTPPTQPQQQHLTKSSASKPRRRTTRSSPRLHPPASRLR